MTKLLVKTLCAIVLIILFSASILIFWLVKPAAISVSEVQFREETALEYRLLQGNLTSLAFSQWHNYISGAPSYFELDARLVPISSIPKSAVRIETKQPLDVTGTRFVFEDSDNLLAYYPTTNPLWQIQFSEGESELSDNPDEFTLILSFLVLPSAIILLSMLLGICYLLFAFSKPLLTLEKAVISFANGAQDTRIDAEENKPIAKVCKAFNTMAEQINRTLREQQLMIAVIPHELRTPINRIRFALDLCRAQPLEEVTKQLEILDGYSYELEQSIEDILLLTKLEANASERQSVNVSALIANSCANHPDTPNLHYALVPAKIFANTSLLQRAFDNLLANAQRYAHSYVTILSEISIDSAERKTLLITIENDGSTITELELDRLCEPFYRSDSSRSQTTGGIGIGLTLVKRIIEREGGTIFLSIIKKDVLRHTISFVLE